MCKVIWKCPHCDLQTTSVDDLDVAAQHMWEEHGIPCEFNINGEHICTGPDALLDRWALTKLRTWFPRNAK